KQKPRLIPKLDGVALAVKDKGKYELIPQIGAQFEINGKKCSKVIDLKAGDLVTVRKHLTFKVKPKTKDAKSYCDIPTPELMELREAKEQMEEELEQERANVDKLKSDLQSEKARLEEIAENTRNEIAKLDA